MSYISCNELSFQYKRVDEAGNETEAVNALRGINLSIERGSFCAIIGKNGSGKSTLARQINALLLPTRGTVFVDGINTTEGERLWEIRKSVGMVFQNPDNQAVSTLVEEDVAFGPENLGLEPKKIREEVDKALQTVGIEELKDKAMDTLSGGQKQRVAIAGILAMKPECIVFDEPTAMLDPKGRIEVLEEIERLNKQEKITVILITHFMEEAVRADKVFVMNDGKIATQGAPREIFAGQEEISRVGLRLPPITELGMALKAEGMKISLPVLSIEEMVEEICSWN